MTIIVALTTVFGSEWAVWVETSLRMALWGLDTIGCLGFLHGRKGVYKGTSYPPYWINDFRQRPEVIDLDWARGIARVIRNGRETDVKLGKWLKSVGADAYQLRDFETRKLPDWGWKVSASPWDILTMSHNRPWTSCMRPGGAYEDGIWGETRAGAALLFWYRPGAGQPCGRELLRPCLWNGKPAILRCGDVYGNGPDPSPCNNELAEMIGSPIPIIYGPIDDSVEILSNGYLDFDRCGATWKRENEDLFLEAFAPFLPQGRAVYKEVENLLNQPLPRLPLSPASEMELWLQAEARRLTSEIWRARMALRTAENNLSQPQNVHWGWENGTFGLVGPYVREANDPRYQEMVARRDEALRRLDDLLSEEKALQELRS